MLPIPPYVLTHKLIQAYKQPEYRTVRNGTRKLTSKITGTKMECLLYTLIEYHK